MKKPVLISASLLLIVLMIAGGLNFTPALAQAPAQQTPTSSTDRTIQVSGTGSVSVEPDTVYVVIGVRTDAQTAAAALSQNNQQMNSVVSAIQQAGIAQSNIQTQYVNLSPRYSTQTSSSSGTAEIVGYTATNTVQVKSSDITKVGQILDSSVQAGANLIQSIRFEVSNPSEVLQQARQAAFNNALQKAQQLATLAGVQLGPVMTINEISSTPPIPIVASNVAAAAPQAVPVQPGTQNVQVDIQVIWSISGG